MKKSELKKRLVYTEKALGNALATLAQLRRTDHALGRASHLGFYLWTAHDDAHTELLCVSGAKDGDISLELYAKDGHVSRVVVCDSADVIFEYGPVIK